MAIRVFHRDNATLRMPMIAKDARQVAWPGVGAWNATMGFVAMEAGEGNVPHLHSASEDTIFIVEGCGSARDFTAGVEHKITAGMAVHVPAGIKHAVYADRGKPIVSVGGPAPADLTLLRRIGAISENEHEANTAVADFGKRLGGSRLSRHPPVASNV